MAVAAKSSWAQLKVMVARAVATGEQTDRTTGAASSTGAHAKPFVDLSFPPLPSSLWPQGVAPPMSPHPPHSHSQPSTPGFSTDTAASPGFSAGISPGAAAALHHPQPHLIPLPLTFGRPNEIFDGPWSVLPDEKNDECVDTTAVDDTTASSPCANSLRKTASLGEVRQGLLANCWLLCALSAVAAQHPSVVEAMFVDHHWSRSYSHERRRKRTHDSDENSGMHRIRLYKGAEKLRD